MYLPFRIGERYNLKAGDCIVPRLNCSEDFAILSCVSDDWYDSEAGTTGNKY